RSVAGAALVPDAQARAGRIPLEALNRPQDWANPVWGILNVPAQCRRSPQAPFLEQARRVELAIRSRDRRWKCLQAPSRNWSRTVASALSQPKTVRNSSSTAAEPKVTSTVCRAA